MAKRASTKQSKHDNAVRAARNIYQQKGMHAWINPGREKNKLWRGFYIDVIVVESPSDNEAWIIEVETEDSVSETEAKNQWKTYDNEYSVWYLAVPKGFKSRANTLLRNNNITSCTVITWELKSNGGHSYWGLPGLS